jgi:hypothetical protein
MAAIRKELGHAADLRGDGWRRHDHHGQRHGGRLLASQT